MNKYSNLLDIAEGRVEVPVIARPVVYWTYEVNKPLIGTIAEFGEFTHKEYGLLDTIIIERETGELVSAILTKSLNMLLKAQKGTIGDKILIVKRGEDMSPAGKTYNKFQLVIDKDH